MMSWSAAGRVQDRGAPQPGLGCTAVKVTEDAFLRRMRILT